MTNIELMSMVICIGIFRLHETVNLKAFPYLCLIMVQLLRVIEHSL